MRPRPELIAPLALAVGAVLGAAPALADATGYAWSDGHSVTAEASSGAVSGGGSRLATGRSRPVCTYARLSAEKAATADELAAKGWGNTRSEGEGTWFRKVCETGDGSSWADVVWVRARPDPEVLAQQAADRVAIPTPGIGMNPAPDQPQIVRVPTWLWLEPESWSPVNATAAAGGVIVTATAAPDQVVWDMGNGDQITCDGPGSPYDPTRPAAGQRPTCTYTYEASSAGQPGAVFTVTATALWRLSWTAVGAPGGGGLGTVRRSASVPVRVAEIQTLNQ